MERDQLNLNTPSLSLKLDVRSSPRGLRVLTLIDVFERINSVIDLFKKAKKQTIKNKLVMYQKM